MEPRQLASAESWDESKQRYTGLQVGRMISLTADSTGLLVKPDVAAKQLQAEQPESKTGAESAQVAPGPTSTAGGAGPGSAAGAARVPQQRPTRFYGSVKIDAARMNRDAATVSNEVVRHLLSELGSEVEITIEVQAKIPQGAPDNVVRTVTENCRTLKFTDHGFEGE